MRRELLAAIVITRRSGVVTARADVVAHGRAQVIEVSASGPLEALRAALDEWESRLDLPPPECDA